MIVLIVATWVYAFPKKEKKKADSISWYGLCSKVNSLDLDELSMLKVLTGTKGLGKVRETVGLIYLTLPYVGSIEDIGLQLGLYHTHTHPHTHTRRHRYAPDKGSQLLLSVMAAAAAVGGVLLFLLLLQYVVPWRGQEGGLTLRRLTKRPDALSSKTERGAALLGVSVRPPLLLYPPPEIALGLSPGPPDCSLLLSLCSHFILIFHPSSLYPQPPPLLTLFKLFKTR